MIAKKIKVTNAITGTITYHTADDFKNNQNSFPSECYYEVIEA